MIMDLPTSEFREFVCEATIEPGVEAYLAMGTQ